MTGGHPEGSGFGHKRSWDRKGYEEEECGFLDKRQRDLRACFGTGHENKLAAERNSGWEVAGMEG